MRKFIFALLLIFIIPVLQPQACYAYDTSSAKYYPLAIGNSWTYHYHYTSGQDYRFAEKVTGTININGHFYYIVTTNRPSYQPYQYCRIDSTKNNIIIYSTGNSCAWLQNEMTGDSLGARLHDSSIYSCSHYYRLTDTSFITLFNQSWEKKVFQWTDYFEWSDTRVFAKGIGFVSYTLNPIFGTETVNLLGCVINGIVYGDTSMIAGVTQISIEVPNSFSLSQNYPNPFNPATSIKFSVPQKAIVTITIYNVLGEEVTKLVNEEFSPGTYETNWPARTGGDAANYPSGVYYYQLTVNSEQLIKYTETKKMVLMK